MKYVTYDSAGNLTGSFDQDLPVAHANNYIEVTDAVRAAWTTYQANPSRTGVQTAPTPAFNLAASSAALIKQIDFDVDAIYSAAVGNRSDEYNQANTDATAYKSAAYTGTVPANVQSWATAKGWTAQVAADDILAAAAKLASARDSIRSNRLLRKEQARLAADAAALNTVAQSWAAFVISARSQLGV